MFIPDLGSKFFPSRIQDQKDSGPRIRIKDIRFKDFLSSREYDLGCSSPDPDLDFFYLSWIQSSNMPRVPDPQHCSCIFLSVFVIPV
jgi:hypothetical protein